MSEALCVGKYKLSNKTIKEELCPGCPVKQICYIEGVVYGESGTWGEATETERKYLPNKVKQELTIALWREGKFSLDRCREPLRAAMWIAEEQEKLRQVPVQQTFPAKRSFSFHSE